MTRAIPTIQEYMSASPHSIGVNQPMTVAHSLMQQHRIRHLPVLKEGKIVGLVSDRDLHLLETLSGVDPREVLVEEAMSQDPYVVPPDAALDEVAGTMAENKHGSAVIVQHGKVVGMFTTVDACRALAELLHSRLAK